MKGADSSSRVLCGTSLVVSLLCLVGVVHVEYRMYDHEQTLRQEQATSSRSNSAKQVHQKHLAFPQVLGKREEKLTEIEFQSMKVLNGRFRRDSTRHDANSSSIDIVLLRHHIREELRAIIKTQICAKGHKICLRGPRGSRGRKGRQGKRGPPGPRGKMGPRGPIGKHGPKGLYGQQGSKGEMGRQGPPGPLGPHGPRGKRGPQGTVEPISAPIITDPIKPLVVNQSGTAWFNCVAKGNPSPAVTWSRPNLSLSIGRHVVHSNGGLSIKRVTSDDAGNYTCIAKSVLGVVKASTVLRVQVPPRFVEKPKFVIVEEKANVTLVCGTSGFPIPTISWSKSFGALPEKRTTITKTGNLRVNNIKINEGGNYICVAENFLGKIFAHAQVTVLPTLAFVEKPPESKHYLLGDRVSLQCSAVNALAVVWTKDNQPLVGSSTVYSNGTLVISKLTEQEVGTYICQARNFHRSINARTNLQVKRHPKSCSEIKSIEPTKPSGDYVIDPDGQSGNSSFSVYCNMTDKSGVGVTVVGHDSEARTSVDGAAASAGSYKRDVCYKGVTMDQLAKLTQISTNCEQFIQFECQGDVLFIKDGYGWWVSRDNVRQDYWGGATPGSKKCACGMTNSCQREPGGCNCNNGGTGHSEWHSDSGLLTDKSTLPVTQLRFADTDDSHESGYHTLGKLKCYG